MKKIAILTSKYRYEKKREADIMLLNKLNKMGLYAQIINWDNEDFDFSQIDLAIVRSCWDYDQRVKEFLIKMEKISKVTKLINPFNTIKNNSDKKYLKTLEKRGVKIVETYFVEKIEDIEKAISKVNSESVILKPSISASGKNTYLIKKTEISKVISKAKAILEIGTLMIQPFFESIQTKGEKSTVVIDGQIIFTVNKTPKKGGFLVHTHKGGTYKPSNVDKEDLPFINNVIASLPKRTAYVRIDYLFDKEGNSKLLELEMIEPNLYLDQNPIGLQKLCDFILKEIK